MSNILHIYLLLHLNPEVLLFSVTADCSWQSIFYKKQRNCVKCSPMVTDNGLYDRETLYEVNNLSIIDCDSVPTC